MIGRGRRCGAGGGRGGREGGRKRENKYALLSILPSCKHQRIPKRVKLRPPSIHNLTKILIYLTRSKRMSVLSYSLSYSVNPSIRSSDPLMVRKGGRRKEEGVRNKEGNSHKRIQCML